MMTTRILSSAVKWGVPIGAGIVAAHHLATTKKPEAPADTESLCTRLSGVFRDKTLFLPHPYFYHSKLIKDCQCKDSDNGTAKLSLDLKTKGLCESKKQKMEIVIEGFEKNKDMVDLHVVGENQPLQVQTSSKTCAEFWKFLVKQQGYHQDLQTSGDSSIHFLLSPPSCREVGNETRIYFTPSEQEICFQEAGKPFKTCSSHLKIKEGSRGCEVNGVKSKNNCFYAQGMSGDLHMFYASDFNESIVKPKSEGETQNNKSKERTLV